MCPHVGPESWADVVIFVLLVSGVGGEGRRRVLESRRVALGTSDRAAHRGGEAVLAAQGRPGQPQRWCRASPFGAEPSLSHTQGLKTLS